MRWKHELFNIYTNYGIYAFADYFVIFSGIKNYSVKEHGINIDTFYGWNKRAKDARLDLGIGNQTPDTVMSLMEEVRKLRQQNKAQAKEINRLKAEHESADIMGDILAASMKKAKKESLSDT